MTRTDFCTFAPRNNLYNTNAEFDWGDFRRLAEEVREASQKIFFFLFQFQHPGTYVLELSSNQHKKMVCIKEFAFIMSLLAKHFMIYLMVWNQRKY